MDTNAPGPLIHAAMRGPTNLKVKVNDHLTIRVEVYRGSHGWVGMVPDSPITRSGRTLHEIRENIIAAWREHYQ